MPIGIVTNNGDVDRSDIGRKKGGRSVLVPSAARSQSDQQHDGHNSEDSIEAYCRDHRVVLPLEGPAMPVLMGARAVLVGPEGGVVVELTVSKGDA